MFHKSKTVKKNAPKGSVHKQTTRKLRKGKKAPRITREKKTNFGGLKLTPPQKSMDAMDTKHIKAMKSISGSEGGGTADSVRSVNKDLAKRRKKSGKFPSGDMMKKMPKSKKLIPKRRKG